MTTTLILKHLVIVLLQRVEKQKDRTAVIAHSFRLSHSCTVR